MLVDDGLVHEVHGHFHGRRRRPLAGAGLQEIQLALLDRELDVLHVLVVALEPSRDGEQLIVDLRHPPREVVDVLGRADAGHHVLTLRVGEELRVEPPLAGARIAREADTRAGGIAQVAEHHRHHADGGAPVGGDVVDAPVLHRLLAEPGVEHRADGEIELLTRLLRKRRVGARGDDVLVRLRELAELGGRDFGIALDAEARLQGGEMLVERLAPDTEDDVAEHRDESAVAIPGESLVPRPGREAFDGRIVEAEIEDRLHHAGHRHARARPDGDEQRALWITKRQPRVVLELFEGGRDLVEETFGERAVAAVVRGPRLRRDREARRNRDAEVRHLGKLAAFAAEEVTHHGRAFSLAASEGVDVFRHGLRSPRRMAKKVFQFYWISGTTVNAADNACPS